MVIFQPFLAFFSGPAKFAILPLALAIGGGDRWEEEEEDRIDSYSEYIHTSGGSEQTSRSTG